LHGCELSLLRPFLCNMLPLLLQGIFQALCFGVGQGLGALIGGLLKQRHGGQAMFALCSGIVLAGWLLCVLAEQATAHFGNVREQSSNDDTTGSSEGSSGSTASKLCSEQPWRQGQQAAPAQAAGWLRMLLGMVRNSIKGSGGNEAGPAGLSSSASSRVLSRQQKYAELASKDSGPDLQRHLDGCFQHHQHAAMP
jgi:predicted lipid-binding transport protein (Tim44 family)